MRYEESLHYVVDKPFLVLYGREQFPGNFLKAAVLMEAIIRGHPFTDGNKRTGYLSGITLLELLSGVTVEADDDEIDRRGLLGSGSGNDERRRTGVVDVGAL